MSNAVNSSIPFLLIPVLTRYLSPSEYGLVSIFQIAGSLLTSIVGVNAHNAVIVQYYKRDQVDFPNFVFNALLLLLVSTLILLIGFLAFSNPISALLDFPSSWLWTLVVFAASQFLFQLLLGLWIASEKPLSYGFFQVSQTVLNLSLSLLLVVPFAMGWKGRVIGQVIVFLLYALIVIVILHRMGLLKRGYNRSYIKKAFRFGIPLIPHTLGGAVVMISDRLIISNLLGVDQVGVYMVGYQFAQIILLIQDSINNAFAPWVFKNIKVSTPESKRTLVRTTYWYFLGIFAFAVVYSFLVPPIYRVFVGPEFSGGLQFILWIAIGFAFNGMYKMVVNYIFYTEKTYLLAFITSFTAVLNVCLSYLFVSSIGPMGAAYSICISYLANFLLTWYFSNRVFPMPWSLRRATIE